ncbi:MAG: hypothetical protein ACR5LG_02150 [Sodalis sp. (in: enterobacteria)]|uniref:hypothetical protein n=1 Tax=Sodalis sp. (in: enterobacteria) TaxID=1898979 RepID=UPI003F3F7CA9
MGCIVSCRFHHAADHNGILFLLQSPRYDAPALYAHLQAFLADMMFLHLGYAVLRRAVDAQGIVNAGAGPATGG